MQFSHTPSHNNLEIVPTINHCKWVKFVFQSSTLQGESRNITSRVTLFYVTIGYQIIKYIPPGMSMEYLSAIN